MVKVKIIDTLKIIFTECVIDHETKLKLNLIHDLIQSQVDQLFKNNNKK